MKKVKEICTNISFLNLKITECWYIEKIYKNQ